MVNSFDDAQDEVVSIMKSLFGEEHIKNQKENALRMLEEALELAQACGVDTELVKKVTEQVYNKPVGKIEVELAQTCILLFRIAHQEGIWLQDVLEYELNRIQNPDVQQKIRDKQQLKVKAY